MKVGRVFDEKYNPPKPKPVNTNYFTTQDVSDLRLRNGARVERSAAPVAVGGSDVRTRMMVAQSGIAADAPKPRTYRLSTGPTTWIDVDEETWNARQRNIAAKEVQERRLADEQRAAEVKK